MPTTKAKPRTIDEFLAGVNAEQRAALEKLRKTIRAAAPKAEECISYGLAAFRLNGRPLVAFGASANHCAFYPMNSTTVAAFHEQLKSFETSKGTIRFAVDKPLPTSLVKKLVKARNVLNDNDRDSVAAGRRRRRTQRKGAKPQSFSTRIPRIDAKPN